MPTIKDVAKEAGVSIATVSYVLNNKIDAVSEETRQEVWRAVEKIGYMPNVTARNLRSSRSRLIGYAWHEQPRSAMNPVLHNFAYFLAQAAEAAGYHLLTFTFPSYDPIPVYDELIRTGRVDGFIIASTVTDDPRVRYLLKRDFPFVAFGRANSEWDFAWVDTDGEAGFAEGVNTLRAYGHERIAMIAYDAGSLSGNYRVNGYISAMQAAGLPIPENYIWRGIHDDQTGREALSYWCALPLDQRPTAILAVSDMIAVGVCEQARQCGIHIGRDVSVIGFDNMPLTQYLQPSMSTFEQPLEEIGRACIDMLCTLLAKQPLDPHERNVLLPPRLILRDSVGSAP